MLNYNAMAADIVIGIGQSGPPTQEVLGFAHAIVDEITLSAAATFGGIPGPHTISGMSGSSLATRIASYAGYPTITTQLQNFAGAICSHIQTSGIVTYTSPIPPTIPNYFLGGTISGLSGSVLASQVQVAVGFPFVSSQLLGMCSAIANHIVANAEVVSGVIS